MRELLAFSFPVLLLAHGVYVVWRQHRPAVALCGVWCGAHLLLALSFWATGFTSAIDYWTSWDSVSSAGGQTLLNVGDQYDFYREGGSDLFNVLAGLLYSVADTARLKISVLNTLSSFAYVYFGAAVWLTVNGHSRLRSFLALSALWPSAGYLSVHLSPDILSATTVIAVCSSILTMYAGRSGGLVSGLIYTGLLGLFRPHLATIIAGCVLILVVLQWRRTPVRAKVLWPAVFLGLLALFVQAKMFGEKDLTESFQYLEEGEFLRMLQADPDSSVNLAAKLVELPLPVRGAVGVGLYFFVPVPFWKTAFDGVREFAFFLDTVLITLLGVRFVQGLYAAWKNKAFDVMWLALIWVVVSAGAGVLYGVYDPRYRLQVLMMFLVVAGYRRPMPENPIIALLYWIGIFGAYGGYLTLKS